MRTGSFCLFVSSALLSLTVGAGSALARSGGAPAGRSGAPGESTCMMSCHTGTPVNGADGSLQLVGVPALYEPGQSYTFWVELEEPGQSRWGFQLTALDDGHAAAGLLAAGNSDSTQTISGNGKTYVEQTGAGTWRAVPNGPVTWRVEWTAPAAGTGEVTYWFTGNAANNNGGSSGDHIYAASFTMGEAGSDQPLNLMLSNIPTSVPRGGTVNFTASIKNETATTQTFDAATLFASGPVPTTPVTLYDSGPVPVAAGATLNAPVQVPVPAVAPTGAYMVDVQISMGGQLIDTESFNIDVTN